MEALNNTVVLRLAKALPLWVQKGLNNNDFQQCGILTSVDSDKPVRLPLSLETPNDVRSAA